MHQLRLPFTEDQGPDCDPLTLLRNGAALVLSVSGGKDSDAMTHHLLDLRRSEGWIGDVMMVHAVRRKVLASGEQDFLVNDWIATTGEMPSKHSVPICKEELTTYLEGV